jgi:(1->4)-alpha-D-glucan 1-alpha-D-glucosylmutase
MLATSTHDSKRSEDVRARINVLSELPLEWHRRVRTWREINKSKKRECDGAEAPSANDEYLFYQTLIGAWPFAEDKPTSCFRERVRDYTLKALREAKEKTSWSNQNTAYEDAVTEFVDSAFDSQEFRKDFLPFQRTVAYFGMLNSLAQTLIKFTVPGVPDVYQGNEVWEFALVDPDNRRAVDYECRRRMLEKLRERNTCENCAGVQDLTANMEDGRIKLFVTWNTLTFRKQRSELFQRGEYLPLAASGEHAKHVIAFERRNGRESLIVVVPRLCAQLLKGETRLPVGEQVWRDTKIEIPPEYSRLRNLFTGELVFRRDNASHWLISEIFQTFSVALLVPEDSGK